MCVFYGPSCICNKIDWLIDWLIVWSICSVLLQHREKRCSLHSHLYCQEITQVRTWLDIVYCTEARGSAAFGWFWDDNFDDLDDVFGVEWRLIAQLVWDWTRLMFDHVWGNSASYPHPTYTSATYTTNLISPDIAPQRLDPEAKARASGSEREMGQARARENFSRSEREK